MAVDFEEFPVLLVILLAGATLYALYMISKSMQEAALENDSSDLQVDQKGVRGTRKTNHHSRLDKSSNKKRPFFKSKDGKDTFKHNWLLTTLKGHSSTILDMEFSPNGKYLATCGEDRAVLLWETKDWFSKVHRNVRINVKYDYASMIRWSPDSKAFIIKRHKENVVEAYKINKGKGSIRNVSPVVTYPRFHDDDIIGLGLSTNGKYLMTSSNGTEIVICDLKGSVLTRLNSYVAVNYSAHLSPCGRLIIATGFVPDARVWHVEFAKSGEFTGCTRLYDLKGHNAGIQDTAFDASSSKVATVSKDGTWKLFDISDITDEHEPAVLATGAYEQEEVNTIALSPLGDVVAVTSGSSLSLFDTKSSKLDIVISEVFSGSILKVLFDSEGKHVLVCGDRHVRIFHNITGIKAAAEAARIKLKQPNNTSALNERLREQISTAEAFLASYTS